MHLRASGATPNVRATVRSGPVLRHTAVMTASTTSTAPGDPGRGAGVGPVWTVGAVARRLGMAPSTLRTWSLRYGIGPEGHLPGQHRRYSADDVAELDTIRRFVEQGVVLAAAAAMAHGERHTAPSATTARDRGPGIGTGTGIGAPLSTQPFSTLDLSRLVAAARRLDSSEATALVAQALAGHGVVTTWDTLCRPALTALCGAGPDPETTAAAVPSGDCVDAELVLQWAVATSLRRVPTVPPLPGGRPVLMACAESEHHTLALEALNAALLERGIDVRMLGPSVPDSAVLAAARTLQPATVVVWAQTPATAAPELLHALSAATATVIAAGPGWDHTVLQPAITRADTLPDALALTLADEPLAASG